MPIRERSVSSSQREVRLAERAPKYHVRAAMRHEWTPQESWPTAFGGISPAGCELRVRLTMPDRTRGAGRAVGALRFGCVGRVAVGAMQSFRWPQQY
jgi:hypothetical protein